MAQTERAQDTMIVSSILTERANFTISIDADHTVSMPAELGGELMQGTVQIVVTIWASIIRHVGRDKPDATRQTRDLQIHETHPIRATTVGNAISPLRVEDDTD